jgi:2-phospho-L-lactate guanylyltransferase
MAPDVAPHAARPPALSWSLVIPVKVLARAKSRLTGLAGQQRADLALAMAGDTIAAATRAAAVAVVLVVTDDPDVSQIATGLGALVLPDEPAAGLNEALAYGAARAQASWPERGRAGLAGDVPSATPEELTAALAAAARLGAGFVPDADGTGTVLYAAAPGTQFRPQFGPASRDRHLAAGAAEIGPGRTDRNGTQPDGTQPAGGTRPATSLAGLRRDVDTIANLREAAALGLGPRTGALLAADASILA